MEIVFTDYLLLKAFQKYKILLNTQVVLIVTTALKQAKKLNFEVHPRQVEKENLWEKAISAKLVYLCNHKILTFSFSPLDNEYMFSVNKNEELGDMIRDYRRPTGPSDKVFSILKFGGLGHA